jgi:ABC-type transport system involved in multi-copper enzyme maturation permease subunit
MKEARQIFWPFAVITCLGLLSLLHQPWHGRFDRELMQTMIWGGLFLGLPLLATLPFGAEFQYRTLGLTLAQPVPRHEIWRLKFVVTLVAIVPPSLLYAVGGWRTWHDVASFAIGGALLVLMTTGAIYWTLVGRSTIGGLALNACAVGTIEIAWLYLGNKLGMLQKHDTVRLEYVWATVPLSLVYAAVLIWLGRRKLIQYQAAEGMQADETVIPGAQFVPQFFADWFRCRPGSPVLNLVRREFRLLRIVWPLAGFSVIGALGVMTFILFDIKSDAQGIFIALSALSGILTAILAGSISLGEEKNWGTHDWHMTIPVSTGVQWFVKMAVALFCSIVAGVFIPAATYFLVGVLKGGIRGLPGTDLLWLWTMEAAFITIVAFWAACVTKGTVHATLFVFPVFFLIGFSVNLSNWISDSWHFSERWLQSLIWRLDPVALNISLAPIREHWFQSGLLPVVVIVLAAVPMMAVVAIQSFRRFRGQIDESKKHVFLALVPVIVTSVLVGFAVDISVNFVSEAVHVQQSLMSDTHHAIQQLQSSAASPATRQALKFTADDLARTGTLSDESRRWLSGSTITVAPSLVETHTLVPDRSLRTSFLSFYVKAPKRESTSYVAVIQGNGHNCYLEFTRNSLAQFGFLNETCQ